METRNILDSLGNIIGELTLPEGTSEDIWSSTLSLYSIPAPTVSINLLNTLVVTGTGSVTTSSSTPATIGSMSLTPSSGCYIAFFSGSIFTDGTSAKGEFGIYVNGVLVPETRREISCSLSLLGGLVTISLNAIGVGTYTQAQITLDGSQTVEAKFKSSNGGTIGFLERSLILVKDKNV